MPIYEYECEACRERFEVIQKFSDAPADTCTKCGKGPVRRLLSSPAIQFKGSGWYITDYAKKSSSDKSANKPADKDSSKTEPTSAESKADSAPKPAEAKKDT